MSSDRLDSEWVRSWCARVEPDLAVLTGGFEARHGYPPGRNAVSHATDASHRATSALVELTPIPSDLTTLYWVVSEISLPDVDHGYFVHSPDVVAEDFREYGPVVIDGEEPALVFGSDGGGRLLALSGSGRVWMSVTAAFDDQFDLYAAGLQDLLDRLAQRITAAASPASAH